MRVIAWNCRGLGNPRAIRAFNDLLKDKDPEIVFISETKLGRNRMNKVKFKLGFSSGFFVDSINGGGGLALLWKDSLNLKVMSFSDGHIDALIKADGDVEWRLTGFYGNPVVGLRKFSWDLLRRLAGMFELPWLCLGDFNEILEAGEKWGGAERNKNQLSSFKEAVEDSGLWDLGYTGNPFTWSKGKLPGHRILERLDRAFANVRWCTIFPDYQVSHLSATRSDHLPIMVSTKEGRGRNRPKNSFKRWLKFEQIWTTDMECQTIIQNSWRCEATSQTSQVDRFISNSKKMLEELSTWGRAKYGNISRRVKQVKERLEKVQYNPQYEPQLEIELRGELETLLEKEELYWKQRSKVEWLKSGDRNTKFFHSKANQRRKRNAIERIQNHEGHWLDTEDQIMEHATSFFKELYSTNGEEIMTLDGLINDRIPIDLKEELGKEFTVEDIKDALMQMDPWKAPGPDGLHAGFYQSYWSVVEKEVTNLALSFLNGDCQLDKINQTHIVLIPKIKRPTRLTEYRPISLCNVCYKIVAKALACRIKKVLPYIIDDTQSAFVKGRLITDNILVAFEVFHWLKQQKRNSNKFFGLKLDMNKAFDRVEWKYLELILHDIGFPSKFCMKLMDCVRSATLSILINGKPAKSFKPTRGLRQGDPLSPYLFIICAEGLSAMIKRSVSHGIWNGIRMGYQGPTITHLFFADDSLLFAKLDDQNVRGILNILGDYERLSGQKVNLLKSRAYCSANVSEQEREELAEVLGVKYDDGKGVYLGLPYMIGRSKKEIFSSIKEKVRNKLKCWKEKLLTQAGKEVLIKSVVQAVPTYSMSCFKIPKTVCDELQSMIRRFWWGQKENERRVHWLGWEKLCAKKDQGGMGFRNLEAFNLALLAKQGWRLIKQPDSLAAKTLKAKYYPHTDFRNAKRGSKSSYLWQSICDAKELLSQGLRWRIGNGEAVSIWDEPWLPRPFTFKVIPHNKAIWPRAKVSDLIDYQTACWKVQLLNNLFLENDVELILKIPLASWWPKDELVWHYSKDGEFSVKSAYHLALELKKLDTCSGSSSNSESERRFWIKLWQLVIPPRVKVFLWKACNGILPTMQNLHRRLRTINMECPRCGYDSETDKHLFLECCEASQVWEEADQNLVFKPGSSSNFKEWFAKVMEASNRKEAESIAMLIWSLWKSRNEHIFEGIVRSAKQIHNSSQSALREFQEIYAKEGASKGYQNCEQSESKWKPPPQGYLKLNVDAAFKNDEAGVGVIVRNYKGEIEAVWTEFIPHCSNAEVAETMGFLKALQFANEVDMSHFIVEGDSLTVIKKICAKESDLSSIGHLIEGIRDLSRSFPAVDFMHVKRANNKPAHEASKLALKGRSSRLWFSNFPDSVLVAVNLDIS